MSRTILVYGHGDKSLKGFRTPEAFVQYIQRGIFQDEAGRYRYSQMKAAEIVVLTRDGLAFGHFEIDSSGPPTDADRKAYRPVKQVYRVRKSVRYGDRVRMSRVGISKYQFGKYITEEKFEEILRLAGTIEEFSGPARSQKYQDFGEPPDDDPNELQEFARRVRRGQPKFRKLLLRLYAERCAITGWGPPTVLEAAHIVTHSKTGINQASNGLLLRSDIHVLFDARLIRIDSNSLTVFIAESIRDSKYGEYHGRPIFKRVDGTTPGRDFLREHFDMPILQFP